MGKKLETHEGPNREEPQPLWTSLTANESFACTGLSTSSAKCIFLNRRLYGVTIYRKRPRSLQEASNTTGWKVLGDLVGLNSLTRSN